MATTRGKIKGAPPLEPWKPPPWEPADAAAIQACAMGLASVEQQKRAIQFIVKNICGTYDLSFRPGGEGDRDTAFAEGKRFVGLQIFKFISLNVSALRGKLTEQGTVPSTGEPNG